MIDMRRLRKFLLATMVLGLLSSTLEAKPKKATSATPKATPDPKKDPQIRKILSDLKPAYPHLTASEVLRTSNHDLRRMYEHLYQDEGLNLLEAKHKAALVPLKEN